MKMTNAMEILDSLLRTVAHIYRDKHFLVAGIFNLTHAVKGKGVAGDIIITQEANHHLKSGLEKCSSL